MNIRLPLLALLAAGLAHGQIELARLDCGQEPGLRSLNSANPTQVQFINATGQGVKTYWRDFNGQRVFYYDLPAGANYHQETFVTHPWVVTDASDRCIAIFMPVAGAGIARIGSTTLRLSLSPTTVVGGTAVAGTVALNAPADGAGVVVSLSSSTAAAQPPAGVLVPTGLLSANFSIPTTAVTSNQAALITASRQNDSAVASFTITPPNTVPQVLPSRLAFTAVAGSETPAPQSIRFLPGSQLQLAFSAFADNGADGTPAPPWISVQPPSGTAPANISVSVNTAGLQPGTHSARVVVSHAQGGRLTVPVTLVLQPNTPPSLDVAPAGLSFAGTAAGLAGSAQSLLVRNLGGGGAIPFRASVASGSSWLTVSPLTGQTSAAGPVAVEVRPASQTLDAGVYVGEIRIESGALSATVPVALLVYAAGPVLSLDQTGFRIDARSGQGNFTTRQVAVLNTGTGSVSWSAELLAGSQWLNLQPRSGQATPASPSVITFNLTAGNLPPGPYYALIRLTDPAALNGPQYITGVLNMLPADAAPSPEPSPAGLFFTTAGPAPPAQTVRVAVSSLSPVNYRAAANTRGGGAWLSVTPTSGNTSTAQPAQLTVAVNPAGLAPGIYTGEVAVSFIDDKMRAINVTLVVQPPAPPASSRERSAAGCAPSSLALTETALANSFSAPAGWPVPISLRVTDNCADPVATAQVIVSFSNDDPLLPLKLTNPQLALYSATWTPRYAASQATVRARATAGPLGTATAILNGGIPENNAPILRSSGPVLNNLYPQIAAPLAPGTVVQIHGSGLATATVEPGVLPLPFEHNGTKVLAGLREAPLYYLSDAQLNAQLPAELAPDREYSIVVAAQGGYTQPGSVITTKAKPGLLAFADGRLIAQHLDYSLITADSPARPDELITIYLVGMGGTDPSVASGAQAPGGPLASASLRPVVTIGGRQCEIIYAGLTPGAVGLYQVNLRIPAGAPAGNPPLVVRQGDAASNEAVIPVVR